MCTRMGSSGKVLAAVKSAGALASSQDCNSWILTLFASGSITAADAPALMPAFPEEEDFPESHRMLCQHLIGQNLVSRLHLTAR